MSKYHTASVYRSAYGDCTNGGESSYSTMLAIVGYGERHGCIASIYDNLSDIIHPPFILEKFRINEDFQWHWYLVPAAFYEGKWTVDKRARKTGPMHGGNIATFDAIASRALCGIIGITEYEMRQMAFPVHDRYELFSVAVNE